MIAALGADAYQRSEGDVVGQGLDRQVMCCQTQQKANCSDEDVGHRRSKLAGLRCVAWGYESEEKSRNVPIRRRRSRP